MPLSELYKSILQPGSRLRQLSALNPMEIRKKGTRAKAFFALGLVCFFWGTTWIASRQGVLHMPALQLSGIRQTIGGLCYVIFFLVKGVPLPKGKEWIHILVLSFLTFMLSNGLSTWGVEYISSGLGSIMGAIFPLWLVIIGLVVSRATMPRLAIIGLILGFAGVCIIFYEHLNDFLNPDFRFGILISMIATWTWAFATLYTKKHAATYNPYFSLGLQMLISGVVLIAGTAITDSKNLNTAIPITQIPWQSWVSIAYLVVFGSIISFVAYLYALQNLSAEQTSIYAYVNPVVAVFFGWLLFEEKLTVFIIAGGVVALYGIYLVNKGYKVK